MTRLKALHTRCLSLPYSRLVKKLTLPEVSLMRQFIADHNDLGHLEFEYEINRMFLFNPQKPKNWAIIQELLTISNSACFFSD